MTRIESPADISRGSWRAVRGLVAAATLLSMLALALPANAAPTPAPADSKPTETIGATPGPAPEDTPASASQSPAAQSPTAQSPTAQAPTAQAPTGHSPAKAGAADGAITLSVSAIQTPVAGRFFEDIGRYAISGIVGADDATATVAIYRRPTATRIWTKVADSIADSTGAFSASVPVTDRGAFTFAATIGGAPATTGALVSNEVGVSVENSYVVMDSIVTSIDSLKDPTVSGRVFPARAGVAIVVEVLSGGAYVKTTTATTGAAGTYKTTVPYGRGNLATYRVRTRYATANRPARSELSTSDTFKRIAVINAVITGTTAAEVAKTYRAGCPVGPSKLRTITLNHYGFDKRMHRGVIIVRKNLTTKIIRGFSSALKHKYRIAKMNNPNVYGGNDPQQMAANNTSGFNCRKVVGNPYKMSPHTYGIAIDVNTVQNPYRDSKGKWWPKNGKAYIKRSPKKPGMLTKKSYLTKSLRKSKFFWGGFWYPGRDYQHFEYRG